MTLSGFQRIVAGCATGVACFAVHAAEESLPPLDCVVNPNQVVDISSPVPGVLEQVNVDRSDYIEEGTVVARLASGVEQATVELARARTRLDPEINASEVNLEYDRKRKARIESLYGRKVVSVQNKEEAEREAELSAWKLEQTMDQRRIRELELKRALQLLEQKTIRATLSGVVVKRFKSRGEYVEDDPIIRIAQLDPLRVDTIVPMTFFGQVSPGMKAMVHAESAQDGREARVTLVDAVGDPGSGTFGVQLSLDNPDFAIPAGTRCQLTLVAGSGERRAPVIRRRSDLVADVPPKVETHATEPVAVAPPPARKPSAAGLERTRPVEKATQPDDTAVVEDDQTQRRSWHPIRLAGSMPAGDPAPAEPDMTEASPEQNLAKTGPKPVEVAASRAPAEMDLPPAPVKPDPAKMADEPTGSEVMPRRETGVRTVALGPFRTYASAERAAEAQATAHGLSGYRVFQKIVVKSGGLVVSAKGEPRRDVIERLRAAGIKDFLQMNVPPYDGRVALGYYLSDAGVERRVRHLQRVGVNSEVVARETETTEYWVELKTPGDFDTATLNLPGKELQLVDGHGGR